MTANHEQFQILTKMVSEICKKNEEFKHRLQAVQWLKDSKHPTPEFIAQYMGVIDEELLTADDDEMVETMQQQPRTVPGDEGNLVNVNDVQVPPIPTPHGTNGGGRGGNGESPLLNKQQKQLQQMLLTHQ